LEDDDFEKKKNDEQELFIVERRYCTACNLEQPLRTKHCEDCQKCIAQYDHHCPWVGTCIGEKNHLQFWWFLVFQSIQACIGMAKIILAAIFDKEPEWIGFNIVTFILMATVAFFTLMVVSLLIFHSYLAMANQTTWENMSW